MTAGESSHTSGNQSLERAVAEYLNRRDRGESVDHADFINAHPSCAAELRDYFEAIDLLDRMKTTRRDESSPSQSPPLVADSWERLKLPFQFGQYLVLRRLGYGGMGTVYLANDTKLEREVALKIPQFKVRQVGSSWLRDFLHEAKATIQHPNICAVHDADVLDDQPYICMAYIKGQALSALVKQADALPEQEVASFVRIISAALEAAHRANLVHRDIKPGNIMIDENGLPIILDFGLAYRLTSDAGNSVFQGRITGTLAYMSPEQLEAGAGKITKSTDVYSLGVTFYEMLTKSLPFQGTVAEIKQQIRDRQPAPPSELRHNLHPRLAEICMRMMAKRPADRFPSMDAVERELRGWLQTHAHKAELAGEMRQLQKQVKRLSLGAAVAVAGWGILEVADRLAHHAPASAEDSASAASDASSAHLGAGAHDHAPILHADPQFGTPVHDAAFWEGRQNYADTCAIRCQEYILQQFRGVDFPEKMLVEEAKSHGWYEPGHGTTFDNVGNLLELHGVPVHRYTEANVFHLANELAQGHKVIIGVDSSVLWGHNETMDSMLDTIQHHFELSHGADHAVVVSGIDTTDPHHVRVIISDPGDGKAVASYPMEQFLHAWEGSHFYMVATQEAAPAYLPEMVHFDYASGHIDAIDHMPYEDFVEHFADAPDTQQLLLDYHTIDHSSHLGDGADTHLHVTGHSDHTAYDDLHPSIHDNHHDYDPVEVDDRDLHAENDLDSDSAFQKDADYDDHHDDVTNT